MGEQGFELRIEKIVAGGDGLGRKAGRVVFVPNAIAEELHWVVPEGQQGDFIRARSERLLERSQSRQVPPCAHHSDCGGCRLMHVDASNQLEVKRGMLFDTLRRVAKIDYDGPLELLSAQQEGYRTRARFHFVDGRLGLFGWRSRKLARIDTCLQVSPELNHKRRRLERWLSTDRSVAPYLQSVELQEPSQSVTEEKDVSSRDCTAHFVVSYSGGRWHDRRGERLAFELAESLGSLGITGVGLSVASHPKKPRRPPRSMWRAGSAFVRHQVGPFAYQQSVGSFFQSNRFLLTALVESVLPPDDVQVANAVELHCGVGLFTLPLSRRVGRILACDASVSAIRDAKQNAAAHGVKNAQFYAESASHFFARKLPADLDWAVLDPPRSGLTQKERGGLIGCAPKCIRYVSCDAATFARDARELLEAGFLLSGLALVDLFPSTHHFELVASFARQT